MTDGYGLSKREEQVIGLLLEGKSNKQIALALNISESTVEFHLTRIYARLGVRSRGELFVLFSRPGKPLENSETRKTRENPGRPEGVSGESLVVNVSSPTNNKDSSTSLTQENQEMDTKRSQLFGLQIVILSIGIIFLSTLVVLVTLMTQKSWNGVEKSQGISSSPTAQISSTGFEIAQGISLSPVPRARHTATRLPDGRILLVGGQRAPGESLDSVDLVDLADGSTARAASLHTPRHDHTATLLQDGRVLVVGGSSLPGRWLEDAEVYDPLHDRWTVIPPLYSHGTAHSATLMADGRVLVVGGCIGSGVCTNRVEIFDPGSNSWTEAQSLASDRASQTAQLLADGRVLIAGGENAQEAAVGGAALLYDPRTDNWTATGPMLEQRVFAESVRLNDGKILVAGGAATVGRQVPQILSSAEIYDPVTNTWIVAAPSAESRYEYQLVLLTNGQVLAVGGAMDWDSLWSENSFIRQIEIYDPVTDRWQAAGELPRPEACAAAALLADGRLWVTGGVQGESGSRFLSETWLISP